MLKLFHHLGVNLTLKRKYHSEVYGVVKLQKDKSVCTKGGQHGSCLHEEAKNCPVDRGPGEI